jgi:hypothetical protein
MHQLMHSSRVPGREVRTFWWYRKLVKLFKSQGDSKPVSTNSSKA